MTVPPAYRDARHRVLAVLPHPDDEAYGCAGSLYAMKQRGDTATALLTLTDGEASTVLAQGRSRDEVAALRRERMEDVADILSLDALLLPGLPDGGLARLPLSATAAPIVQALQDLAPHVLIVQDPRGVNAHLDHVATHWAARYALEQHPVPRVAMIGYPPEVCEAAKPRLLLPTPHAEIDVVFALTPEVVAVKESCLRVHDAIVTLQGRDGVTFERPPFEYFDLLGEDHTPPLGDLLQALDAS